MSVKRLGVPVSNPRSQSGDHDIALQGHRIHIAGFKLPLEFTIWQIADYLALTLLRAVDQHRKRQRREDRVDQPLPTLVHGVSSPFHAGVMSSEEPIAQPQLERQDASASSEYARPDQLELI